MRSKTVTITRSCGHDETVTVYFQNASGRERKIEWLEGFECSDCRHEREADEARAKMQEMNLVDLDGTAKQVRWAETIRADIIKNMTDFSEMMWASIQTDAKAKSVPFGLNDWLEKKLHTILEKEKAGQDRKALLTAMMEGFDSALASMSSKNEASWWIDHRTESDMILRFMDREQAETKEAVSSEAKTEATIRPKNEKTPLVAEISVTEERISVCIDEKNSCFIAVVKELGYSWSGSCWQRTVTAASGPVGDRTAELGHRLLDAGFPICIMDADIRKKAVDGNYQAETTRWIFGRTNGKYVGWFVVKWGKNDDFYAAAKRLPGACYDRPSVVVPPDAFAEVEDFAAIHGFSMSDVARGCADAARAAKESELVISPAETVRQKGVKVNTKPSKLEVPETVEVCDDLRDDD